MTAPLPSIRAAVDFLLPPRIEWPSSDPSPSGLGTYRPAMRIASLTLALSLTATVSCDDGGDDTCARGCTAAFRCLSGYCPFVTEFCGCCFWFCVPSEFGPAPWSKIGMFHLRQVFGSGHPALWAMPRASPPQGARGSSQLKKE